MDLKEMNWWNILLGHEVSLPDLQRVCAQQLHEVTWSYHLTQDSLTVTHSRCLVKISKRNTLVLFLSQTVGRGLVPFLMKFNHKPSRNSFPLFCTLWMLSSEWRWSLKNVFSLYSLWFSATKLANIEYGRQCR